MDEEITISEAISRVVTNSEQQTELLIKILVVLEVLLEGIGTTNDRLKAVNQTLSEIRDE